MKYDFPIQIEKAWTFHDYHRKIVFKLSTTIDLDG